MRQHIILPILLLLAFSSHHAFAQDQVIRLKNPSFEDPPRAGKPPTSWNDCGFSGETPPDIQPGEFGASKAAYDGNTYMGLVVRDNDSWERVSQRLSKPILADQCYSFSLFLARSDIYLSASQLTNSMVQYSTPCVLRIWGGDDRCSKNERLAESELVTSSDWNQFDFKFEPSQTHTYILFEVFYKTPTLFPYNGNILIDNASPITPISCDEEVMAVKAPEVNFVVPENTMKVDDSGVTVQAQIKQVSPDINITFTMNGQASTDFDFNPNTGVFQADLKKFKKGKNILILKATNQGGESEDRAILMYDTPQSAASDVAIAPTPPAYDSPTPKKELPKATTPAKENREDKTIEGMSIRDMKKGQTIKLNKLYFGINQSGIGTNSYGALTEIYDFLKYNEDVVIEIGGHTNGNCDDEYCDELSKTRAKAVAEYLTKKGIAGERLEYKGYGKRSPISSNKTAVGRKKNQRVEIKILSLKG